jgi:hypothetical protein
VLIVGENCAKIQKRSCNNHFHSYLQEFFNFQAIFTNNEHAVSRILLKKYNNAQQLLLLLVSIVAYGLDLAFIRPKTKRNKKCTEKFIVATTDA